MTDELDITPTADEYAIVRRGIPTFDTSSVPLLEGEVVLGKEIIEQEQLQAYILALTTRKMDELIGSAMLTGKSPF